MFTVSNIKASKAEFKSLVSTSVDSMYGEVDITAHIKSQLVSLRIASLKLVASDSTLSDLVTMVSEKEYTDMLSSYTPEYRKTAWKYRTLEVRIVLLQTLLINKKKISFLCRDVLTSVVSALCEGRTNEVTLSQIVHRLSLKSDVFVGKDNMEYPITSWGVDELRLQLINELCELNYLDLRVSHKTHMLSIPSVYSDHVVLADWQYMARLAMVISRKTILVEPAPIADDMISQSSWWYRTPELSSDQVEFVHAMHTLKWEFIPTACDDIEEAFRKHLDVPVLPAWAVARVEEFKTQIKASYENDGHYIAGKFDSALRWYWQSEIGHTQSSEFMRKLVRPVGMENPVKYDMSNNVVQMYSLAMHDRSLAKYVGLVPSEECVTDLRQQISDRMNQVLSTDVFHRDNIKPLFMVWAYNAGMKRLLDGVYSEEKNFFTGEPMRILKVEGLRSITHGQYSDDTLSTAWDSILRELVPSIIELKRVMSRIVKGNPFTCASWVMPDGAVAQYASVETLDKPLHWVSSTLHTHTHTHHRKELVPNAKAAGLLPRMIHSLDAYVMRQLVIRAKRLGITIVPNHDSFMFDDSHTHTIFSLIHTLFIEIMDSHSFKHIVDQFNSSKVREDGQYLDRELLTHSDILASVPMKLEDM